MTTQVNDVRPRAQELHKALAGGGLYRKAAEEGMNLSTYLEEIDPSKEYNDGLDAFSRQMKLANIAVRSMPQYGIWADDFEKFDKSDSARALVPEWIARQARSVSYGARPDTSKLSELRSMFLSGDHALNGWMKPYVDDNQVVTQPQITPQIPLDRIVARTTGITGDAYRAFYLTRVATDLRMTRVAEATEIPRSKLTGGERIIRLSKYGRALETSYEQLRRMKIDLVQTFIQLMMVQAEVDKVAAALEILVNGDGNVGTAPTVHAQTALDPGSAAGTLTLKAWLSFKMKFLNPYTITTMIGQEASLLQAFLLSTTNSNIPLVMISGASGFGGFSPINPGLNGNVAAGWMAEAPALKLVGFDSRFAVEHITEIGGDITETERYVNRQTQELVMSTVDGFRTLDAAGVRILDINA